MAAAACIYGYLVVGSGVVSQRLQQLMDPANQVEAIDPLMTLEVGGSDVTGADVYVNKVHLGKTPVTMTTSEFFAKVPVWEPNRAALGWNVPTGAYSRPFAGANKTRTYNEMRLDIDWQDAGFLARTGIVLNKDVAEELRERREQPLADDGVTTSSIHSGRAMPRKYYVQMKHKGEFGWAAGNAGSTRVGKAFHYAVQFRFPTRERMLETLLDQARLADYQVDDAWFEAMEAFGDDGWMAVAAARTYEPEMQQVYDEWARRRHGIQSPRDRQALSRFKQICEDADRIGFYATNDLTGRAVELLARQIAPRDLVGLAEPAIRDIQGFGWLNVSRRRPTYFYVFDPDEPPPRGQLTEKGHGFAANEQMRPSYLAIAHALWTSDGFVDESRQALQPTYLQSRIGELVVRFHSQAGASSMLRQAAVFLGCPAVEKFELRKHLWTNNRDPQELEFEDREFLHGQMVNRWLWEAANLPTAEGRRFRQEYAGELVRITDVGLEYRLFGSTDPNALVGAFPYLFMDNELGQSSLAWRYWPRFRAIVLGRVVGIGDSCYDSLSYLIAMEPISMPQMYADVWAAEEDASTAGYALRVLEHLPPAKRVAVLEAIGGVWRARTMSTVPDPSEPWKTVGGPWRENGVVKEEYEKMRYEELDDPVAAAFLLGRLREMEGDERRRCNVSFAAWLAQHASQRPYLIEQVAAAPEPEIRVLAVPALREHPIAANRTILEKLTHDADESVRTEAATARQELSAGFR
jgi:hypothetical protein